VLHKPAPVAAHAPWGSPDDDDNDDVEQSISPTTRGHTTTSHTTNRQPFTTTSTTISSNHPRGGKATNKTRTGLITILANTWRKLARKLATLDPIKLAYLRTSFVFAISILVTWTPSSINRVYSLVYPTRTSYPLNLAGAVVLPLQGLWNAIIFAATSWRVLGEEFREIGFGLGFGSSRRLSGGSGDPGRGGDERGKQIVTGSATLPAFRSRDGSIPENRELATMAPPPRMANVRVIRGGSL
jgi:hypothetical protein